MRIATLLVLCVACGDDGATVLDGAVSDTATDVAIDTATDAPACPTPRVLPVATTAEVTIGGDVGSTAGIFDPSVVYPVGAPGGAMAYSSVPAQNTIRTRIALSPDAGATWTFVAEPNAPQAISIASSDATECPGGTCSGNLISEVPTLVFDPTDPTASTRWKLYAHRYLVSGANTLHYGIGTMTVQTAPDPQGPWTPPEKLFGLDSPSPFTTQGARYNASTFPALADCLVLTEASAIVLPNILDLAMGCVYLDAGTPRIRVVLVRSLDHGLTWAAVGTMLGPGAADCLPGTTPGASINAPNLFVAPDGKEYVSVTSSDTAGYHGCAIFHVDDPGTGHVAARPTTMIVPDTGQFSGACTWSGGGGGYQLDIGFLTSARPFRIFRGGATF